MEEKQALDELKFIKKVIQDSQRIIADNGMGYIVWGVLCTIGMLSGYVKFKLGLTFNFIWLWVVIISIGWGFSYFKYYRTRKEVKIDTFASKVLGHLWFSFGMALTIIGFGGVISGAIRGDYISGVMAIILGSAYYLTTVLYNQNWFKIIGIAWWVAGVIMFYVRGLTSLLIMAIMMIVGQIIPGIVLYRKYRKQCCDENE